MHEAKRNINKAIWTWCKDMLDASREQIRGIFCYRRRMQTTTVSINHASTVGTRVHFPGHVHASFSSSAESHDWRPVKAHVAMHQAIKIFQQQEEVRTALHHPTKSIAVDPRLQSGIAWDHHMAAEWCKIRLCPVTRAWHTCCCLRKTKRSELAAHGCGYSYSTLWAVKVGQNEELLMPPP